MATMDVLRVWALALGVLSASSCRRAEPLPDLGVVRAFALSDQAGRGVTAESLRGKPTVAAFMFTRCPTVCPRIAQRMKDLQGEAKRRELDARFVSVSVDPEHDTPAVLMAYAEKLGADLASWSFLTGDSAVIQETAEKGFKIALDARPDAAAEHYGISHGSHLILVDGSLHIRGYYRSSEDTEMKRLLDDISGLAR